MDRKADVIIVGTGAAGAFAALSLPRDKEIIIITKRTQRAAIPFWLRAGSVCSGMKQIMKAILKIRCVPDIMRTEKNP